MHKRLEIFLISVALLLLSPCAAFAVGALTIDGSSYNSADLSFDQSGTGWSWLASANSGQGELILNGYDGGSIESTDGVLNIRLTGENIITTNELKMLNVHGTDTGLNLYGSDPAADTLITRSNIVVDTLNPIIYGIYLSLSNSTTIPFSLRNISYRLDMSQATSTEFFPGYNYPFHFYGISITQTVHNTAILGIDMQMDNTVLTMSNETSDGSFLYGMWANPYYSSIQAVFNSCTFNLSDFSNRG